MFQTRCKFQNTFLMFQTRCKYSKHAANVSKPLLIIKMRFKCFKGVANIQNTLLMFQTRCKYSKHVVNVSTAFNSQRVANSRKKNNVRQVSATVTVERLLSLTCAASSSVRLYNPEGAVTGVFFQLCWRQEARHGKGCEE